jgi:hypothetical protein
MEYVNSDQLIFVLASPAGGGYRLGRIICCLDNVYWYKARLNGKYPYSIYPTSELKGKDISSYHFDRRTELGMVPLIGERIERFWNNAEHYYSHIWPTEMQKCGADKILASGKQLVWVLHDMPNDLAQFPNAKIINLVDIDVENIIDRYLVTTALFPVNIENSRIKPKTDNSHSILLKELMKVNTAPTYRDFWMWETYRVPVYSAQYSVEYRNYVSELIKSRNRTAIKENPKHLAVTWDTLDIETIKQFVGASTIDENYKKLLI